MAKYKETFSGRFDSEAENVFMTCNTFKAKGQKTK